MKKKLQIQTQRDFLLWGILSTVGGHKLAWEFNNMFGFKFTRAEDIMLERPSNNEEVYFNFYHYEDEINFFKLELVKNKSEGDFFSKELKNFDFLLMVKGELDFFEIDTFSAVLKRVPSIQSAISINLDKLKDAAQLIVE